MDHPSFSIGITQIVTVNTNRISDYEDPNGAENMSNRLHDPITMAKQSSKKSKPKKEAHGKTPKKRGRKVASAIYRSALPTTEYVSENDDPTRPKSDYTPPTKDDLVNVE
ncbi:hypothetical protein H5410_055725 [Solanum commersonii]|uniref:Uncharacterized protein n=1 Tax=Solanum commersonii TaxID=4109 RepID=A0A9J5WJY9_SOLCO|nr:hypothetical protein H5410_055725 [Solanum commersonii]